MIQTRIRLFLLISLTVVLGLVSRQIDWIPLFIGDILYAIMMFFIVKAINVRISIVKTASVALAITYVIEFSQLYQAEWINSIRRTVIGKLVLGQGFLWSDLAAYAVGIVIVFSISNIIKRELQ